MATCEESERLRNVWLQQDWSEAALDICTQSNLSILNYGSYYKQKWDL